MKRISIITLILLIWVPAFAQDIVFKDVRFETHNLIVVFSIVNIKVEDILEALKRGLEGQIEYSVQIVEEPLIPLLPKTVIQSRTVKKRVLFDFYAKSYTIIHQKSVVYCFNDEVLVNELFSDIRILLSDAYKYRNSNYRIRAHVNFTSVKMYFPLNLIFEYIVGIWDFSTGWVYGPKLSGIPYSQ